MVGVPRPKNGTLGLGDVRVGLNEVQKLGGIVEAEVEIRVGFVIDEAQLGHGDGVV